MGAATRRGVLRAALLLPLLPAAATALARFRPSILALRPPGAGSSASRCGQCGGSGHGMLDASCPAAPKVL